MKNLAERPLNLKSILNKSIKKNAPINLAKKRIKIITLEQKYKKGRKNFWHSNIKRRLIFDHKHFFFFFFKNQNFIKVNLPTHACLRRNCKLILIQTLWSYSKCEGLLHTLNVYKILAKKHEVVDHWAANVILLS